MTKQESTETVVDERVTAVPVAQNESRISRRWNAGHIFWGLLLVLIGMLFLLQNLDVVDINFANLWMLWPIFIIMIGVSMVALRGWLGVVISALVAVAALTLVTLVALDVVRPGETGSLRNDNVSVAREAGTIEKLKLTVEAGAGTIDLSSASAIKLVDASLKSTVTSLSHHSTRTGTTQEVRLSMNDGSHWWNGRMRNDLRVVLGQSLPTDLKIDAGAAKITADLAQVNLQKLDIDSGASSLDITLGTVNKTTDVSYDIGASSITLRLPRSSGVSLTLDSGLSGTDLSGLKEVSDNYYQSDNFSSATHQINIHGKMGMANLTIAYY